MSGKIVRQTIGMLCGCERVYQPGGDVVDKSCDKHVTPDRTGRDCHAWLDVVEDAAARLNPAHPSAARSRARQIAANVAREVF